jgi:tripartite-type tricarboxylate transporter receptor subunit TctC
MISNHRGLLRAGLSAVLGLSIATVCAQAETFPTRPIKLVVPYAAGGPTDILGRAVAEILTRDLKQTVVVENKPGAQGAIGAEAVARSEPDGYTLFVAAGSIIVQNPLLNKKLTYDPVKDFRMLSLMADVPVVMEVNPSVPVKSVAEFVDYAKKNPGTLNFGSAGTGGSLHLAGEMFKYASGVQMTHVPYRGTAPALTDLLAGQIQVMFDTLSTSLPHIRAGSLRPLAVGSRERIKDLPDVPSVAESGFPDYRVSVWYGVAAPARVPDAIAATLKASLDRALGDSAFRESIEKIGYVVHQPRDAAGIAKYIDEDRALWTQVISAQKISLD